MSLRKISENNRISHGKSFKRTNASFNNINPNQRYFSRSSDETNFVMPIFGGSREESSHLAIYQWSEKMEENTKFTLSKMEDRSFKAVYKIQNVEYTLKGRIGDALFFILDKNNINNDKSLEPIKKLERLLDSYIRFS